MLRPGHLAPLHSIAAAALPLVLLLAVAFGSAGPGSADSSPEAAATSLDSAAAPDDTEPDRNAIVADLPFLDVPGSPRIHLDLAPAGTSPIRVILDTSINYPVGSPAAVRALGGKLEEDGTDRIRRTVLGIDVSFTPNDRIDRRLATDEWVRFGGRALERFVVEIDFEKRRVRFLDGSRFEVPEEASADDETVLPLVHFGGRPRADIVINDKVVPLFVDTTVTVPIWIGLRNLKLAAVHPKTLPVLRTRERGRQTSLRLYETDTVWLGDFSLPLVPILVSNSGQADEFGSSGPALGLGLLSQFKVRLDLRRNRLWLQRIETGPPDFFGIDYRFTRASGAFLVPLGNRWQVTGVLPDSPAAAAGLTPGDLFDPELLGRSRPAEVLEAIRKGEPLLVQRFDGTEEQSVIIPQPTDTLATAPEVAAPPPESP